MNIGVHRVIAFFLQLVGRHLVHQTYATTFLLHVNHNTFTFFLNHFHRFAELFTTVAAHTAQDVARSTRGMNTHQDGLVLVPLTLHEGHVLRSIALLTERYQLEMAVSRGHVYLLTYLKDRKSTRLNSSHANISYAVFCLKKKSNLPYC